MMHSELITKSGQYEAHYLAFLEVVTRLRPDLHRYCARMTGSVMDGEDVVQEVLFDAYRKLDTFDDGRDLKPWLFRIAHNRCIDHLRKRGVRLDADAASVHATTIDADESVALGIDRALEHLVSTLPPMERACVLLKDVLDHSLDDIARLLDSTVGGVKAALHRGRLKIKSNPAPRPGTAKKDPEREQLLVRYVERFNRRDWQGVRELISADARLTVVGRYAGRLLDSPYFGRYETWPDAWQMAVGEIDGEPVVLVLERVDAEWAPRSPIRLEIVDGRIVDITDYFFCVWMLGAAAPGLVVLP
jgi:RNA polymerase sigma-70 factor, ECF subfamily